MGFLSNLLHHWKKKNENKKDTKGYNKKKNKQYASMVYVKNSY